MTFAVQMKKTFDRSILDVQVMVVEGVVLLGVEDLEERAGGIAAEVGRHLVDLVEKQHRIDGRGLAHHLDDLTGKGADIGSPVSPDLCFVAHPAEREPHEVSPGCARDRSRERGLPGTRRPDKAQDRAGGLAHQLANRQKFEDSILDLFETVVVLVEDFLGAFDVTDLPRRLLPRHREQPIHVVPRDPGLGGNRRHALETAQLDLCLLLGLGAHTGFFDLLFELLELFRIVVAAELFVDRLDLLRQVVLALRLLHLFLDP